MKYSPEHSGSGGSLNAAASNWEPPPCYYAPRWKASEFKAFWEDHAEPMAYKTETPDEASRIITNHEKRYGPKSKYKDHNIDREEDGLWWTVHANTNHRRQHRQLRIAHLLGRSR